MSSAINTAAGVVGTGIATGAATRPIFNDGQDVLVDSLRTLYGAESQIAAAAPTIAALGRQAQVSSVFDTLGTQSKGRLATLAACFTALGVAVPAAGSVTCPITAAVLTDLTAVAMRNAPPTGNADFVEGYATNTVARLYGYLSGAYGWSKQCATGLEETALVDRITENVNSIEKTYRAIMHVSVGVFSALPVHV